MTTRRNWKPRFIEALAQCGNVRASAKVAGIDRAYAYRAKHSDATFAARWEEALEEATEVLEAEAWRRALSVSDTLLIFLLKARKPQVYRETTRHEVSGPDGGPIKHVNQSELDAELTLLCAEMARREEAGGDPCAAEEARSGTVLPAHTVPEAADVP